MTSRLWLILILALQPVLALANAGPARAPAPAEAGVVCCPLCVCNGCACSAEAPGEPPRPSDEPAAPARSLDLVAIRAEAPPWTTAGRTETSVRPAEIATTRRTASGLAAARLLCVWRT